MKQTQKSFYYIVTFLLAVSLPLQTLSACQGRQKNASATTMHLTKTEGTVQVADENAVSVKPMESLGLYDGYQVATEIDSHAWISLDQAKLAKMDADSQIGIQKDGRHLEILVRSGGLFFNVTDPLEEDETMNIRTSNMMVGIRGTCGWIQVADQNHMQVSLLEGSVVCTVFDLAGRELASETISAGETADMFYDRDGESSIRTGTFPFSDIPPYVLEEVSQTDVPAIRSLLDTLEQTDEASQPESVPETASATEPESPAAEASLPADIGPDPFIFNPGGGTGANLTLNQDGSFSGQYSSTAMESGDGYQTTIYTCSFEGKFRDIHKVNDYTYSMTVNYISVQDEMGRSWVEDGVRYVISEPQALGMDAGDSFFLYTPDAPVEELPEDVLTSGRAELWNFYQETGLLSCYGLYNTSQERGFYQF